MAANTFTHTDLIELTVVMLMLTSVADPGSVQLLLLLSVTVTSCVGGSVVM